MKSSLKIWGICTLLLCFISCESSEGETPPDDTGQPSTEKPSIENIEGNWKAYKAFIEFDNDGTTESADLVQEGGSVNLSIQANGRFSIVFVIDGESETLSGQMSFLEDLLKIVFDYSPDKPVYFEIQSSATTLIIDGGPLEYDFDMDDVFEEAVTEMSFTKL